MPPRVSPAVRRARTRGTAERARAQVNLQWFGREVVDKIRMEMEDRLLLAGDYLRSKVVENISVPVVKEASRRTGRIVVTERSKKGEFPRADTTQLMKTIFSGVEKRGLLSFAYVGTPLDYGLILETNPRLDRSFLVRTLNEERSFVTRILTGPIV